LRAENISQRKYSSWPLHLSFAGAKMHHLLKNLIFNFSDHFAKITFQIQINILRFFGICILCHLTRQTVEIDNFLVSIIHHFATHSVPQNEVNKNTQKLMLRKQQAYCKSTLKPHLHW
jgi:hypothetical protein